MDRKLYAQPDKPRSLAVRRQQEAPGRAPLPAARDIVAIDRPTERHAAPPNVATAMVDDLGAGSDELTLKPSAGTGALLQAPLDTAYNACALVAFERNLYLCDLLHRRFENRSLRRCILHYAREAAGRLAFPRILMNPPFQAVRAHIDAALSLLAHNEPTGATLWRWCLSRSSMPRLTYWTSCPSIRLPPPGCTLDS